MPSDLSPKTESRVVTIITLFSIFVMALPFFVWWPQTLVNIKNALFDICGVILIAAFVCMVIKNYKDANTYETETLWPRLLEFIIALAFFIWIAGWAAYRNELIK